MGRPMTQNDVNEYGLTSDQMSAVIDLQRSLGGSGGAFDYAYEIITRGLPLGTREGVRFRLRTPTAKRVANMSESELSTRYRLPDELCQPDYLRARWMDIT